MNTTPEFTEKAYCSNMHVKIIVMFIDCI
jgi:hypothetical protein